MKVKYLRLQDEDGMVVGFKREIVEYLNMTEDKWTLEPIEFETQNVLSQLPVGIKAFPRAKLNGKGI